MLLFSHKLINWQRGHIWHYQPIFVYISWDSPFLSLTSWFMIQYNSVSSSKQTIEIQTLEWLNIKLQCIASWRMCERKSVDDDGWWCCCWLTKDKKWKSLEQLICESFNTHHPNISVIKLQSREREDFTSTPQCLTFNFKDDLSYPCIVH